jgi:hypothetical protein
MKWKLILLGSLLWNIKVAAQPSFTVYAHFQLIDENGPVDYQRFCETFKMSYAYWKADLSPCGNPNIYKSSFYHDSTKTYRLRGTVVYNDFVWVLIRAEDTMLIECPHFGGGTTYDLGLLSFEPGFYRCYQSVVDTFSLPKGRQEYFNQMAVQITYDREHINNYQNLDRYKAFLRLLKYYGFPLDNWEERELSDFRN